MEQKKYLIKCKLFVKVGEGVAEAKKYVKSSDLMGVVLAHLMYVCRLLNQAYWLQLWRCGTLPRPNLKLWYVVLFSVTPSQPYLLRAVGVGIHGAIIVSIPEALPHVWRLFLNWTKVCFRANCSHCLTLLIIHAKKEIVMTHRNAYFPVL